MKQFPKHRMHVDDFFMSKYLISNYQFSIFEMEFYGRIFLSNLRMPNHPVCNIGLSSAQEYCSWLSKKIKKNVRLPTESE